MPLVKAEPLDESDLKAAASNGTDERARLFRMAADTLHSLVQSAKWVTWFVFVVVLPPLLLFWALLWMAVVSSFVTFLTLKVFTVPEPIERLPLHFDYQPFQASGHEFYNSYDGQVVPRDQVVSRPSAVGLVKFDQPTGWEITALGASVLKEQRLNSTINKLQPLLLSMSVRMTHDARAHLYSSPWVSSQASRAVYEERAAPLIVPELPPWPVGLHASLKVGPLAVIAEHRRSFVPRRQVPSWFWGYGRGLLYGLGFRE
ncbi:MAG: uncharacterized protein KVP18_003085 [Porospora cf. gigantea A]|uniref:uncharacterized protein n=1 Tax=Porospora cf. gigantea A TaxID=2853593 RepID=UPI003559C05A|nr:MAG: hypothetical protein KVP18_003085 [Porospora cf. gigantea A]